MSTEQDTGATESVEKTATATEQVADQATESVEATQPKKLSADEKKAQIVDSFQRRLDSGELTLEEVESRQPWVAEALKEKQKESQTLDGDELKKSLKSELLEELSVKQKLETIESLGLSKDKKAELNKNFEKYKESLGASESIDLAMKLSGIDISPQAMNRRNMALPELGDGVIEGEAEVTDSDIAVSKLGTVKPEQVAKYRTSLEKTGRITRPLI